MIQELALLIFFTALAGEIINLYLKSKQGFGNKYIDIKKKKCSDIPLHDLPSFKPNARCKNCNKTIEEIQQEYFDTHPSEFHKLLGVKK